MRAAASVDPATFLCQAVRLSALHTSRSLQRIAPQRLRVCCVFSMLRQAFGTEAIPLTGSARRDSKYILDQSPNAEKAALVRIEPEMTLTLLIILRAEFVDPAMLCRKGCPSCEICLCLCWSHMRTYGSGKMCDADGVMHHHGRRLGRLEIILPMRFWRA